MVTIQAAIRETAEALLFEDMPQGLRTELEAQLAWLQQFAQQARDLGSSIKTGHSLKTPAN